MVSTLATPAGGSDDRRLQVAGGTGRATEADRAATGRTPAGGAVRWDAAWAGSVFVRADAVERQVASLADVPAEPGGVIDGWATTYGSAYEGKTTGCGTVYHDDDPSIIAVGPAFYARWPCGTRLRVCGPVGCLTGTRVDSCPGCLGRGAWVDLSAAGLSAVCGPGSCAVTVEEVR